MSLLRWGQKGGDMTSDNQFILRKTSVYPHFSQHHMELRKAHELGIILDRATSLIFGFTSVQKRVRMAHGGI
jgi:hypothetical protein